MRVAEPKLQAGDERVRSFRVVIRDKGNPDFAAQMVSNLLFTECQRRGAIVKVENAWDLDITSNDMELPWPL